MSAIAGIDSHSWLSENALLPKLISGFLPLGGILMSLYQQTQINKKIGECFNNRARAIELIELKNQYKWLNIIRDCLTVALIIAGIATGILSDEIMSFGEYCVMAVVPTIFSAVINGYSVYRNEKLIGEIREGTNPPVIDIA